MTLKEMPKVGDKVRYLGVIYDECMNDITVGGTYIIEGFDHEGDAFFKDDVGDNWHVTSAAFVDFELVDEGKPVETSQDVIELLANISRRLYEAEQTIKEQAYEINELYKAVAERG